jgi:hypothetical protein
MEGTKTSLAWLPKCLAIAVAPVILEHIFPVRPNLTLGVGLVAGVFIQHFIPPRGQICQLYVFLVLATAVAIVAAVFF